MLPLQRELSYSNMMVYSVRVAQENKFPYFFPVLKSWTVEYFFKKIYLSCFKLNVLNNACGKYTKKTFQTTEGWH